MKNRSAVFLDRDGTLIHDQVYLNDPDKIEYLPGVFEALRVLRDCGYHFFVVTNQSGVARGIVDIRNLAEIHRRIQAKFCGEGVDILSFHSAPYMTDYNHPMRKPNPGMIQEGARRYGIHLPSSWMIGDRQTDVEAGHRAGTLTALVGLNFEPVINTPSEVRGANLLDVANEISART